MTGWQVCEGELFEAPITMSWPEESPCADRTIAWELADGPEGMTVSEDGWVEWDTTGVSVGVYEADVLGTDECGCEYALSVSIEVKECLECCCGDVPSDATITMSWNGFSWTLERFNEPEGLCDTWRAGPFGSGIENIAIRIQNSDGTCKVRFQIFYDGEYHAYNFTGVEITGECCAINNLELPDKMHNPPGPSAYITMNC